MIRIKINLPVEGNTTISSEVHRATEALREVHIQPEGSIETGSEPGGTIILLTTQAS